MKKWNPRSFLARFHAVLAAVFFLAITLLLFGDVLFQQEQVLSSDNTDMEIQFIPWREFGFGELRQGNLPLWNPHIYGGAPYLGGFQSAMFYPPNWIHLFLPVGVGINWEIAIHVFLAGFFTYLWCKYRGVSLVGSLMAGVMFMFGGPYYLHMYPGHLPHLAVMVWAPLLFLSLDRWFDTRAVRWCLVGMFVLAMQILAGHPQYVYYTGIAAVIYTGLFLIRAERKARLGAGFISMYVGGVALAAVQLLTGFQAARESWRSGGTSLKFAGAFSLPPENFLTLLAPNVLGQMNPFPYFGRWLLWEVSLFLSVSGLVLAIYGALRVDPRHRRFAGIMVLLLTLLSLGAYTPLHKFLYYYLPGFNLFRVTAKFFYLAALFISLLAGLGFDHLSRTNRWPKIPAVITLSAAVLIAAFSAWVYTSGTQGVNGTWNFLLGKIGESGAALSLARFHYMDPAFIRPSATFAAKSLLLTAATMAGISALLFSMKHSKPLVHGLAALSMIELFVFATHYKITTSVKDDYPVAWKEAVAKEGGDYRVLNINSFLSNRGMALGFKDIWGYDPGVLKRYAEFLAWTQGRLHEITQELQITRPHKLFNMLRCRLVFVPGPLDPKIIRLDDILPRLQLVSQWQVIPNRDDIFAALNDPSFDPRQKVILESSPGLSGTSPVAAGDVSLVRSSTDELEIKASLPQPAILLITDAYSSSWRARALSPSAQENYRVMPANYTLRAIPLAAGEHHFLVEYLPTAFVVGKWVTIISLFLYVAAWIVLWRGGCRRRVSNSSIGYPNIMHHQFKY